MSKSTQPAAAKPRKKPFFTNDDLWGYAFIGVAVIFFLMFTIYPLISAVITSLEDYKPFGSDFVEQPSPTLCSGSPSKIRWSTPPWSCRFRC